jgi:hypothetical protein
MDQVAFVKVFAPKQPSAAHPAAIEDMSEAASDQFAASAQGASPGFPAFPTMAESKRRAAPGEAACRLNPAAHA